MQKCFRCLKYFQKRNLKLNKDSVKLRYTKSNVEPEEWMLGAFQQPFFCHFSKIRSKKVVNIPFESLSHLTKIKDKEQLIIADWKGERLKLTNLNGDELNAVGSELNNFLPYAICTHSNGDIYVAVCYLPKIYIFNPSFELKKTFSDKFLKTPFSMCIDSESNKLYATDYYENSVMVLDSEKGNFVSEFCFNKPKDIKLNNAQILLVSVNSVFIINKDNFETLREISLRTWFAPRGLHLTTDGKLLTIAYSLLGNHEHSFFLFAIDMESSKCIQRTNLNVCKINDFCVIDRNLIIITDNLEAPLCIYNFD